MSKPNGTENVSISLPSDLIQLMDELSDRMDLNRSGFVKKAVKTLILQNSDRLNPKLLDELYQSVFDL